MLFQYKVVDQRGIPTNGTIDAVSMDVAIASLQKRGFTISSIKPDKKSIFSKDFVIFEHVSNKDLVILSRQLATLFTSQVSALKIFRMLGNESDNKTLGRHLLEVSDDLQAGNSISKAIAKHPKIFTNFYINIVRSGEESGKIEQSFNFLADYLDRTYEVNAKARNALIYPAFISVVFVSVITLLMTQVIPQLGSIIKESGQEIPIYTRVVIGASDFVVNYGIFLAIFAVIIIGAVIWASRTVGGRLALSQLKISLPYIGNLFNKLYLSRISDNMNTMLSSAIPVVRALEVTADVVDNAVYENILKDALISVKGGKLMSEALAEHSEIPGIMIQMIRVGEETGELGAILKTLAKFYSREVINAVDTLVGLIEPAMIIALAVGVGFLLTAVIVPIYNVASGIQ